jgi:iron(III) transport system permease protein
MSCAATGWLGLAWLAFAILPWYALPGDGWLAPDWIRRYPDPATASALLQGIVHGRFWLLPPALPLLLPLLAWRRPREDPRVATMLLLAGTGGLVWTAMQGLAIDHRGWSAGWLASLFGSPGPRQAGFGVGAFLLCLACLVLLCHGLAARGFMKGDAFLASTIGVVVGLSSSSSSGRSCSCCRVRCATTPARSRRASSSRSS